MVSLFNATNEFITTAIRSSDRFASVEPINKSASAVQQAANIILKPKQCWDKAKGFATKPIAKGIVYLGSGCYSLLTCCCTKEGKTLADRKCEKLAGNAANKAIEYALDQALKIDTAKSASNTIYNYLQESSPTIKTVASCVSTASGWFGYKSTTHATVDAALRGTGIRQKLIDKVFFPLIKQSKDLAAEATKQAAIAGTQYALDIAIDTAALWYVGGLNVTESLDKFKHAANIADKVAAGAKGVAFVYAYGPTIGKGTSLAIQTCVCISRMNKIDEILNTRAGQHILSRMSYLPDIAARQILKGVIITAVDNGLFSKTSLYNPDLLLEFLNKIVNLMYS